MSERKLEIEYDKIVDIYYTEYNRPIIAAKKLYIITGPIVNPFKSFLFLSEIDAAKFMVYRDPNINIYRIDKIDLSDSMYFVAKGDTVTIYGEKEKISELVSRNDLMINYIIDIGNCDNNIDQESDDSSSPFITTEDVKYSRHMDMYYYKYDGEVTDMYCAVHALTGVMLSTDIGSGDYPLMFMSEKDARWAYHKILPGSYVVPAIFKWKSYKEDSSYIMGSCRQIVADKVNELLRRKQNEDRDR